MFLEKEGLRGRAKALIPADPRIYAHLPNVIELEHVAFNSNHSLRR
jgi:type IV secretion system protein VirB4